MENNCEHECIDKSRANVRAATMIILIVYACTHFGETEIINKHKAWYVQAGI